MITLTQRIDAGASRLPVQSGFLRQARMELNALAARIVLRLYPKRLLGRDVRRAWPVTLGNV
jgi:hypothetical protein